MWWWSMRRGRWGSEKEEVRGEKGERVEFHHCGILRSCPEHPGDPPPSPQFWGCRNSEFELPIFGDAGGRSHCFCLILHSLFFSYFDRSRGNPNN